MKNNVAVILPIHEIDDTVSKLIVNSLNTIPQDITTYIVYTNTVEDALNSTLKDIKKENLKLISAPEGKSNFQELINVGVNNLDEGIEYFSILEYDDEYSKNWFVNVDKYISYQPEVSVFMPLAEIIDFKQKKFIAYGNEAPWASSFSEEIGFIDNASLQDYYDYYMTGSVFNVADWKSAGGLKESIKLSFWYEFLLRCMDNGKKVFVIPKNGYRHYVNRDKSLYNIYSETMSEEESQWWFKLAKTECFHKVDRKKEYVKPEN